MKAFKTDFTPTRLLCSSYGGPDLSTVDPNMDLGGGFQSDYSGNDGGASSLAADLNAATGLGATIYAAVSGQPVQVAPGRVAVGQSAIASNFAQSNSGIILILLGLVVVVLIFKESK